jgi:ribosomal protein L13E
MKAINAIAASTSEDSYALESCRHLRGFNAAEVKRKSRRQQRHALRAELPSVVARQLAEGVLQTRLPEVAPPPRHLSVSTAGERIIAFPSDLLRNAARQATVTVTRKRAGQRATVEKLSAYRV